MAYRFLNYSLMASMVCTAPTFAQEVRSFVIPSVTQFDGTFFTPDTIEMIKKFQRSLYTILKGERRADGTYKGKYMYKNNTYGAHDIALIEQQLEAQKETLRLEVYESEKQIIGNILKEVIKDFHTISQEFESVVKNVKGIVAHFIKESCLLHNRPESLLITWASFNEGNDLDMFTKKVHSITLFDQLCTDLLNFFNDLIKSCPKAKAAFDNRLVKWKKIRECIVNIKESGRHIHESEFLKYIKHTILDSLDTVIDLKTVTALLNNFERI